MPPSATYKRIICGLVLQLLYCFENILVQLVIAHRAIKPFGIGILLSPFFKRVADIFRTIIASDCRRLPPTFNDLIQGTYPITRSKDFFGFLQKGFWKFSKAPSLSINAQGLFKKVLAHFS